jgi:hypothetical protein
MMRENARGLGTFALQKVSPTSANNRRILFVELSHIYHGLPELKLVVWVSVASAPPRKRTCAYQNSITMSPEYNGPRHEAKY